MEKIAILGGGVGALTTAFHLTNQPDWQSRYEITVYQMGWRLGGKGACGRNAALEERIEEHGPHVWFGFYETAFGVLKEAFEYCALHGLQPDSPFQSCFPDAMKPKSHFTVMENVDGAWKPWLIKMPAIPGEPAREPGEQLVLAIRWLQQHEAILLGLVDGAANRFHIRPDWRTSFANVVYKLTAKVVGHTPKVDLSPHSILARLFVLANHYRQFINDKASWRARWLAAAAAFLAARMLAAFSAALDEVFEHTRNDEIRHIWHILDIGIANLRGVFEDRLLSRGFETVNDEDYSEWLERHGCHVPWSPLLQGVYDTCFGFENGKTNDPEGLHGRPRSASMEAGTTIKGILQMCFGYSGAYCYKMQSGMGDTIFAPLYLALRHRGVKFEFFKKVESLRVKDGLIDRIEMSRQATPKIGLYEPLRIVKGMPCWPNQPLYSQLVEGEELERYGANLESVWSSWRGTPSVLKAGTDFDKVVLGISVGALPALCGDLMNAREDWRQMLTKIGTTQTQAFQIWCTKTALEMGIVPDPAGELELMAGLGEPINSWADMSQVLDKETGNAASVQYIFGTLEDAPVIPPHGTPSDFPERQKARVKEESLRFLRAPVKAVLPRFDWNDIYDWNGQSGETRFDSQYWRANVEPSERYVLSAKGTSKYRLKPGGSGFANLYLAGDWTDNGFNAGCVEAAALSGKQAASAIQMAGAK
ncbi:MAG: NAD(P)-binding protein [Bryobacteraceae bacterium]